MHILYEAGLLGSKKHIGISNSIFQLIEHVGGSQALISVFHKSKTKLFKKYPNIFEPQLGGLPPAGKPTQLLHSFTLTSPQTRNIPWVQTIFDTIIEHYPEVLQEVYPKIDTKVAKLLKDTAKAIAKEPKLIIAPSQNTKKDLIDIYNLPESRIKVIPLAPHPFFHKVSDKEKVKFLKKQKIDFPFFLFVGPRWSHKNFTTLLKAFAIFKARAPLKLQSVKLIAVGSSPKLIPAEAEVLAKKDLDSEIKIFPYLSQKELNLWYNTAAALTYPSLYEGFGLPPLEAMACDLPVLSADSASLPEITGNAALTFAPKNAEQLAEMMQKILYDIPLRTQLVLNGKKQLEKFSWGKIAEDTIKLYEKLVQK